MGEMKIHVETCLHVYDQIRMQSTTPLWRGMTRNQFCAILEPIKLMVYF